MPRVQGSTTLAVLSVGAVVAGCQTAPVRYADTGVHATYEVAATGAGAVKTTGVGIYHGAGQAIRAPLRDLNLMQDQIAPVLLRAEEHPYDLVGVDSCADVLNRVAELDLSLGPDVDTPKQRHRTRINRGADFAASTALDAAGSAAEHFIPMRGTIKQLSGAQRYENHVKHAVLAGETRRSFLKAIGMAHNCSWPAAPLEFRPTRVADVSASWSAPGAGAAMLASTGQTSAATQQVRTASVQTASVQTATVQTASGQATLSRTGAYGAAAGQASPTRVASSQVALGQVALGQVASGQVAAAQAAAIQGAPAQPASVQSATFQTASLSAVRAPGGPAVSRVVMVSAAAENRSPVYVPVRERLAIPPAGSASADPDQSWRPAPALQVPASQADVVQVSEPVASTSVATRSGSSSPWSTTFASSPARP